MNKNKKFTKALDLYKEEEIEKRAEYLMKIIELDPSDPEAHYNLGIYFSYKGQFSPVFGLNARDCFEKVIKLDPNNAKAYNGLGVLRMKTNLTEGIKLFKKAIEIDPSYSIAHQNLAMADQQKECYNLLLFLKQFEPDYLLSHFSKEETETKLSNPSEGDIELKKRIKKAMESCEKALAINPLKKNDYRIKND